MLRTSQSARLRPDLSVRAGHRCSPREHRASGAWFEAPGLVSDLTDRPTSTTALRIRASVDFFVTSQLRWRSLCAHRPSGLREKPRPITIMTLASPPPSFRTYMTSWSGIGDRRRARANTTSVPAVALTPAPPILVRAATPEPPGARPPLHRQSSSLSSLSLSPPLHPHVPGGTTSTTGYFRAVSSPSHLPSRTSPTGSLSPPISPMEAISANSLPGPSSPRSLSADHAEDAAAASRGRQLSIGSVRGPPSYATFSLDRSPSNVPLELDNRPRVPPPIYLRSSSPQGQSSKGQLKIHVPAW